MATHTSPAGGYHQCATVPMDKLVSQLLLNVVPSKSMKCIHSLILACVTLIPCLRK